MATCKTAEHIPHGMLLGNDGLNQITEMPATLTIFAYFSFSARKKAAAASGVAYFNQAAR
jgi:hypothetical protein